MICSFIFPIEAVLKSTNNLCLEQKNKKNKYTRVNTSFTCITCDRFVAL